MTSTSSRCPPRVRPQKVGVASFLPGSFVGLLVLALLGQVGGKGEGVPGVWGEKAVL